MYTSLPLILFADNPVKILRIILRNMFVANKEKTLYFIHTDSIWISVSEKEWHEAIDKAIKAYCSYYMWEVPSKFHIDKAKVYLYNNSLCKRICEKYSK